MYFPENNKFNTGLEYINESLIKMKEDFDSLKNSIIPDGLTIQPIKTCNIVQSERKSSIKSYESNNYYYPDSVETICNKATKHYTELQNKVELIHTENIPLLEINQKIHNYVVKLFSQIGISSKYTTYDYPSSRSRTKKSIDHTSGYIQDLQRTCKIDDGYSFALKRLETFKEDIEKFRLSETKRIDDEKRQEELKLSKDKQISDAIIKLNDLGKVIGVDYTLQNAVDTLEDILMDEESLFNKHGLEIIKEDFDGTKIIETQLTGEWRHGVIKTIIVQSVNTGKFYTCDYYDSPKDSMSLDDMNSEFDFQELPNYKLKPN